MSLHPRLSADCHVLGDTKSNTLLLHKNASVPWFILVPDCEETALFELSEEKRRAVESEWNQLAAWVHSRYSCDRVNVAAIGNLVPQLHLHIIGRKEGDPAWPGVVWGADLPDKAWSADEVQSIVNELAAAGLVQASLTDL